MQASALPRSHLDQPESELDLARASQAIQDHISRVSPTIWPNLSGTESSFFRGALVRALVPIESLAEEYKVQEIVSVHTKLAVHCCQNKHCNSDDEACELTQG